MHAFIVLLFVATLVYLAQCETWLILFSETGLRGGSYTIVMQQGVCYQLGGNMFTISVNNSNCYNYGTTTGSMKSFIISSDGFESGSVIMSINSDCTGPSAGYAFGAATSNYSAPVNNANTNDNGYYPYSVVNRGMGSDAHNFYRMTSVIFTYAWTE